MEDGDNQPWSALQNRVTECTETVYKTLLTLFLLKLRSYTTNLQQQIRFEGFYKHNEEVSPKVFMFTDKQMLSVVMLFSAKISDLEIQNQLVVT